MRRRITHRIARNTALAGLLGVSAAIAVGTSAASGQVFIDMPPPRPRPAPIQPSPAPPAPSDPAMPPTVTDAPRAPEDAAGRLALQRYVRARVQSEYAYGVPVRRHRPFHPDDFNRWWWWHGPFPVIAPPTIILVEPTPFPFKH